MTIFYSWSSLRSMTCSISLDNDLFECDDLSSIFWLIHHSSWTLSRHSQTQNFLWQKLSSRSRQLQRCQNHEKRRRFNCANAIENIDEFDDMIAQLPSSFPRSNEFLRADYLTCFERHNSSSESNEFKSSKIMRKSQDLT